MIQLKRFVWRNYSLKEETLKRASLKEHVQLDFFALRNLIPVGPARLGSVQGRVVALAFELKDKVTIRINVPYSDELLSWNHLAARPSFLLPLCALERYHRYPRITWNVTRSPVWLRLFFQWLRCFHPRSDTSFFPFHKLPKAQRSWNPLKPTETLDFEEDKYVYFLFDLVMFFCFTCSSSNHCERLSHS